MIKPWLASKINDRFLFSVRKQIVGLVPRNSSVIDIGCGTGSLLFMLSLKIKKGFGIDVSSSMIRFTNKQLGKRNVDNLEFKKLDACELSKNVKERYDVAIVFLVLHSVCEDLRIEILEQMSKVADRIIIVDLINQDSVIKKVFLHLDEILVGHYLNFRDYLEGGWAGGLIEKAGLVVKKHLKTSRGFIDIWVCERC